nr:hydantoinase/oxoprolinase family protein [Candidatus Sigynarchaeota archaeon]
MDPILVGFDIGGVNIKCSSIRRSGASYLETAFSTKTYYPLWQNSLDAFPAKLEEILAIHVQKHLVKKARLEKTTMIPCASITGELSDAYSSKKEGIAHITGSLARACTALQQRHGGIIINEPLFISTDGKFRTRTEANEAHRSVSAANWHATATWVGSFVKNGILIDCGSTTTDIIPIIDGIPNVEGRTDLERLKSGELVYTGVLRATIPSIAHEVPVNGTMVPISFEKFALMADAHLILGNITREQYDCDTADGRSTSIDDSKKRLARTVCEDADVLGDAVIVDIARFLCNQQVDMVTRGLRKVIERVNRAMNVKATDLDCVITGIGESSIARLIAERAGFKSIFPLSSKIGKESTVISSSIAVLYVISEHLKLAKSDGT